MVMPKVEGFDLYKELKKLDRNAKVCFLTASEKYREDLRGREYQTPSRDLFVQKPLSIKNLIKEIQKRTDPLYHIKSIMLYLRCRVVSSPYGFV